MLYCPIVLCSRRFFTHFGGRWNNFFLDLIILLLLKCGYIDHVQLQVGGTILAAKLAKEQGWAINVGGGFHHCCGEKGGGFCAYADISLCIHFSFVRLNISRYFIFSTQVLSALDSTYGILLFQSGKFSRVMIIDLDAHQGNGHEMDFASDSMCFCLSHSVLFLHLLDFPNLFLYYRASLYSGYVQSWYIPFCKLHAFGFFHV